MFQKLVGLSFNPVSEKSIAVGMEVFIFHDKENKFSSRAIAVQANGVMLGHIAEKNNVDHERIFDQLPLVGKITNMSRLAEGEVFAKFKVGEITHCDVEFKLHGEDEKLVKSFNEDISLKFDPLAHKYTYQGKELLSATRYIKKWIKEFDKDRISGVYANSLGVTQREVLDMWESGGGIASMFGTVIHNALEHYEKFKSLGKIIQDKNDLEFNKALPNHPILRNIVESFYRQKLQVGKVETEVLLTNVERGICGFADRLLITGEKKCRVQDYKINMDCETETKDKYLGQMATLPKNKLSKYQMQLSLYARLLELSGWTVEGLDVYVFDGEWKHYPMNTIKLDF